MDGQEAVGRLNGRALLIFVVGFEPLTQFPVPVRRPRRPLPSTPNSAEFPRRAPSRRAGPPSRRPSPSFVSRRARPPPFRAPRPSSVDTQIQPLIDTANP